MDPLTRYGLLMYLAGFATPLLAMLVADVLTRKRR